MALNGVTSGGTTAVTEQYMAWGGYGTDTGLPNLTKVPTWSNSEGSTSGNSGTGYVASDNFNQVACYGNSSVFYQGSTPYIPPILTQNDEPNPDCLVEILSGTTNVNALCDFDGAGNTAALVALGSSYVAASACSMYSVDGLTSGWYLPACGELVYIYPKFTVLQSTINTLGGIQLLNNQPYLTSSEYYSTLVLVVGNGNVSSFGKSIPNAYVRPFAKITLDAQSF